MTETLADWLPIADAATRMGCSTRTVERLAAARKLESRLRPQAGSPAVAVYNPEDVARIAAERRPAPAPFVLPAGTNGNGNGNHTSDVSTPHTRLVRTSADDPIRQLAALVLHALQSPPSPPVAESVAETLTVYMRLDEATARAGVSAAAVRRLIKVRGIRTVRDRAGLAIHRAEFEALL